MARLEVSQKNRKLARNRCSCALPSPGSPFWRPILYLQSQSECLQTSPHARVCRGRKRHSPHSCKALQRQSSLSHVQVQVHIHTEVQETGLTVPGYSTKLRSKRRTGGFQEEVTLQRVRVTQLIVQSCPRLFATLWTAAREAPLSMGFSR